MPQATPHHQSILSRRSLADKRSRSVPGAARNHACLRAACYTSNCCSGSGYRLDLESWKDAGRRGYKGSGRLRQSHCESGREGNPAPGRQCG